MPEVVDLRKTDDPRHAIGHAVQLLVAGRIVAFPTETVYTVCAAATSGEAIGRLSSFVGDRPSSHAELLLKSYQEAIDFVPSMSRLGQRLARRCWPGPVILAFDVRDGLGVFGALPREVRHLVAPEGTLWIRIPAHSAIQEALRLMACPLVASGEYTAKGTTTVTASAMVAAAGDGIDLVLDDGECRYSDPATVVAFDEKSWRIVRPGVVRETMIRRLASEVFLFVCTGNTCRSPLAEGFFRKMLADRLKCGEDELPERGYMVLSAGMAADPGLPASPESIEVARRYGVDLRAHESQTVTDRLLEQADRIFTMTRSHRETILASHPHLADRVELLSRENVDISDPIGAGPLEYETCRVEIERNLRAVLDELPV